MRVSISLLLGTAISAGLTGSAYSQNLEAEVMHQWTSSGEAAAVKVLADQYTAAGGKWIDTAVTGSDNLMAAELARVTGGQPPASMQFPLGDEMVSLASQGLLRNIDDIAAEAKLAEVLPKVFYDVIRHDGHVYAIPVNNHGQSWLWYNKSVLAGAGADEPVTWDDLFEAMDKIKAKGVLPVAIGGQNWQLRIMFAGMIATKGSAGLYRSVLGDRDEAAIRSPEFRSVVETFQRLRGYADEGNINRDWNVAANMTITGQAGFYFQGDWGKGEFTAAGQTAGKEFGCVILGNNGEVNFVMSADAFVFPAHAGDSKVQAQDLLAKVMIDPATQALFNAKKGSLPARIDVDPSTVDSCTQYGLKAMANPDQQLASVEFLGSGDFSGALDDLIGQLWTNTSMTADQFIDQFATVAKTIP
jgi:glucose/mannose transport system substrate-binding protein